MSRFILLRLTEEETALLCEALQHASESEASKEDTPERRRLLIYLRSRLHNVRHTASATEVTRRRGDRR